MNVLKKTLIEYQEKTSALIIKKNNYRFYQIPPNNVLMIRPNHLLNIPSIAYIAEI